jgi:hypothetical protein
MKKSFKFEQHFCLFNVNKKISNKNENIKQQSQNIIKIKKENSQLINKCI